MPEWIDVCYKRVNKSIWIELSNGSDYSIIVMNNIDHVSDG